MELICHSDCGCIGIVTTESKLLMQVREPEAVQAGTAGICRRTANLLDKVSPSQTLCFLSCWTFQHLDHISAVADRVSCRGYVFPSAVWSRRASNAQCTAYVQLECKLQARLWLFELHLWVVFSRPDQLWDSAAVRLWKRCRQSAGRLFVAAAQRRC